MARSERQTHRSGDQKQRGLLTGPWSPRKIPICEKHRPAYTVGASLLSALAGCGNPDCDATGEHPSPMYRIATRDGVFYRCYGRGRQRHGCGNMVLAAPVDAVVEQEMSRSERPVTTRKFVPGTNYDADIERVGYELKALPGLELDEAEEDKRRTELRAERKELQDRPSTPDQYVMVETGQTFGQVWAGSDTAQKRAFLKAHADDFRVLIGSNDRDVAVVITAPASLLGAENPDPT